MTTICPKCRYQRQAADSHVHQGICPSCGIAYAKFQATAPATEQREPSPAKAQRDEELSEWAETPGVAARLKKVFLYVPDQVDAGIFWGRLVLYVLFAIWGVSFIVGGIDWEGIGGSFMHNINLPFHEFGHVLFGFFGRFMGILGGSLFQVLFPLIFVFAFSWKMKDNFAASICLWWCGQSFIDVSPYIADARYRAIPLIRGLGEEYHDWGNLLSMTNSLDIAGSLAMTSFIIGSLLMLASFVWGGYLLWQQSKRRSTD